MRLFDKGACADIYLLPEGKVLKAFKRKPHVNGPVLDWTDHDLIVRAQFRAEAQAYENLISFKELAIYTPQYYGRANPNEMLNVSTSERYIDDCGFILELIPGKAVKLAHLKKDLEQRVSEVAEKLRDTLKIGNVWDASCFVPGTRAEFTLIDFSLWDPGDYEIILHEHGVLSNEDRDRLIAENAD